MTKPKVQTRKVWVVLTPEENIIDVMVGGTARVMRKFQQSPTARALSIRVVRATLTWTKKEK